MSRVVVLVSGSGTLLAALLDACAAPGHPVQVVAVGADREGTGGAQRAQAAGVAHFTVDPAGYPSREAWGQALADAVHAHSPDWVVSAGFMRILPGGFLARFPGRVLNTHPALLPSFPGLHAQEQALTHGVRVSGVTVHLVTAELDAGPIIAQEVVRVTHRDTVEDLVRKGRDLEKTVLARAVLAHLERRILVYGNKTVVFD